MEEFWDVDSDATLRAVDMYIAKLRDKFADRPEFKIVTVYGMGYKGKENRMMKIPLWQNKKMQI